ncbi:Target of Myb protein [Actinidia chinensis var. chinensis]|uniref:Target of Myb protein n=1 Tax=Actinidia chinensis var. chinensis TaxID=1590841 RepID=A0A2R6PPH4_ACTCC|nr:Target of Myb protein [Actinidia chinensis var. chinensis]
MDKLKLASSSLGERLKTGGAQMGRIVSTKMKEILQTPTPESKMVDEATSEHLEEPNWGMNLRICAMINSEEFSGSEVVKAVKRRLQGKSATSQRLCLDLLEACSSNCEKVFSEVASEKVLDEMVRMIEDPRTDQESRGKAMQLIEAWGESEDLKYLPVFHQTYMNLKAREMPPSAGDMNSPPMQYSLESYIHQQPMPPPDRYPVPDSGFHGEDNATFHFYGSQSVEEKKEILEITRNSLDILSSILNSETEPKPMKDDLTISMLEKCKEALPVVQRVVESTTDDEVMLFEALNLNEELQQIISKYEEMEAAQSPGRVPPKNSDSTESNLTVPVGTQRETAKADSGKEESTGSSKGTQKPDVPKTERTEPDML